MKQVSHEVPLALLEESRKFNDYDYCLVHKYLEDVVYAEFYRESLRQNRTVILDNSLFELEEMFDHEEFANVVKEMGSINPDKFYYIVPDALEEKTETINSAKTFLLAYPDLPGKSIGVTQGKDYEEILECFLFMQTVTDRVAISFDYSWYEELYPNEVNKYQSWMKGRQELIHKLASDEVLDFCKDGIHLLGCGVPQEFKAYKNIDAIKSIDTSNPVVMGMLGHNYTSEGLEFKESIKLVDLFDAVLDNKQLAQVEHNVKMFKSFT